jgi:hypothetical protein
VSSSSTRSPRIASKFVPASPKKTHTVPPTIPSTQISQWKGLVEEDFQIIDEINPSADSETTVPTSLTQSLPSRRTGETCQDLQGEQNSSRNTGHPPFSDLMIDSRVQMSTGDPNNPLVFGVIRWIGVVKNGGRTAGVEMVNLS